MGIDDGRRPGAPFFAMRRVFARCFATLVLLASALPAARAGAQEVDEPPPWSLARDGHPLAGYQDGKLYVRDATDNFRLFPGAMVLFDGQGWMGRGTTSDPALAPRGMIRAARLSLAGNVLEPIAFQLSLSADGQPLGNADGTRQSSSAAPGVTPTDTSARYEAAQTPANTTQILDAWINLKAVDALNLMVGQFREPFSMENATGLKTLPFHERSIVVRSIGGQNVRDVGAMLWGDVKPAALSYYLGVVGGDGRNRPGVDRRADLLLRATWQPLVHSGTALERLRVGASLRAGWRQSQFVNYDRASVRTQQGLALWSPTYTDSLGRRTHVIPADRQRAVGAELWLPVGIFDLRSELVLSREETREAVDGFVATNTERTGTLRGAGGYVIVSTTLWGKPGLMGTPGNGVRPASLSFDKRDPVIPEQQLEALLRFELLGLKYESADRRGTADAKSLDGEVRVVGLGAGVNYWATRHARLSANYNAYLVPKSGTAENRARVPADARGGGDTVHELGARFGVMF